VPCDVVLGGQWGDEGKGKIVDVLSADCDAVVRCQGGANAGHTLVVGDSRLALHQIPSGVRYPACTVVLASGMVVDPLALLEEMAELAARGLDVSSRLRLSAAAHLVLPSHRIQDRIEEERRGTGRVGTTGRGIGPAYADKAARRGLQLGIFAWPVEKARAALSEAIAVKAAAFRPEIDLDIDAEVEQMLACRDRIAPFLCDTTALLQEILAGGGRVLLEGAQGVLLDLDHGSYPYVTSSACTAAGALAGCGLPPQSVRRVHGVLKAYATRVGNGPFPSELVAGEGDRLRELGAEYGATTGRPRRCGWFDVVAARHAARLSGFTTMEITKLDVLDHFDTLRICVAYELDGSRVDRFPADACELQRCRPVWQEVEGWRRPTTGARRTADLPPAARRYIELLQSQVATPVGLVSVGPERDSTFPFTAD
jgi:adenylosuccinate synthase